ncbi:MAG: hypothetical protein J7599_07905 [Niabella sp.]|nr:hypothetical protein [Niabella sp.]
MKCGSRHFTDFRKGGIALQMRRVVVYMHALVVLGDQGDMRVLLWAAPMALRFPVVWQLPRNKFRRCNYLPGRWPFVVDGTTKSSIGETERQRALL